MAYRVKRRWLEERLHSLNLKKKDLADAIEKPASRITDLLKGERRLQISEAVKLAGRLKCSLHEIYSVFGITARNKGYGKLLISGYIDATTGAMIARSDMAGEILEEIDAPFPGYEGIAVRIKGTSMSPRYRDGEIVGFSRDGQDIKHLINQEVVVETEDGRILLKTLHLGTRADKYTLVSLNPNDAPIMDVGVRWAAPIDFHIPRKG